MSDDKNPINPTGKMSDLDDGGVNMMTTEAGLLEMFPNQPNVPLMMPAGAVNYVFNKLMKDCSFENMDDATMTRVITNHLRDETQKVINQGPQGEHPIN